MLPKKHPMARRRKSLPVPKELVDMVKDQVPSGILPDYIKAVYLFKVPRYTVEQSHTYVDILVALGATVSEALFTSLLVSHKLNHDMVIKNATWAKHTPITNETLNRLERQLFNAMHYQVYIK